MSEPSSARSLRILHYPTDVGGNPTGLARAERALGADSTVAVVRRSSFRYPVDVDLRLGARTRLRRLAGRAAFAARSAARYDVFHFNFGATMLPRLGATGLDLPLLRGLGKRLFMTFQGCDARQTAICRQRPISCCGQDAGEGLCTLEDDARKIAAITYAHRHCHRVFCLNPDVLPMVPDAELLPYASVDPRELPPSYPRTAGPLTVLHAPTSRLIKGTEHVLAAREALGDRHPDVRWLLVEGLPHAEAMQRYRDADVVVDQLKIGWYGGFGVEMMMMGKPVVCYVREEDLAALPAQMVDELPVIRATPATLTDVLDDLLSNPARLAEIGRRSRMYAERWHDPRRTAGRLLDIYEDPTRPFWDGPGPLPAPGA